MTHTIITDPAEAAKTFSFEIFDEHEQPVGHGDKSYNRYFSIRAKSHLYVPYSVYTIGTVHYYREDPSSDEWYDSETANVRFDGSEALDVLGDNAFFWSDVGWGEDDRQGYEYIAEKIVVYCAYKEWKHKIIFDVKTGKIIHHNGALVFDA